MAEPIRVLQVLATLDRGGAETVIVDWLRHMDRGQVILDFVVNDGQTPFDYEQEVLALGSHVVRAPALKIRSLVTYVVWWYRTLASHPEWNIVHAHHTTPAFLYLSIARLLGRSTIAHSHTGGRDRSIKGRAKSLARWPLRHIPHVHLACSRLAMDWMFGSRVRGQVIHNAIDLDRFDFDQAARARSRLELQLDGHFVIGHVGRFTAEKNHERLLQVFAEVLKRRSDARLLLVGDGPLKATIEARTAALGINDLVVFTGVRQDVPNLLSAMDFLVFPSLFEGLPVVIVEAQASGLPCVVSDSVTDEVGVTDLIQFMSLEEPNSAWAQASIRERPEGRRGAVPFLRSAGYGVAQVADEMRRLYLQLDRSRTDTGTQSSVIHPGW